jgi:hypothetical protein
MQIPGFTPAKVGCPHPRSRAGATIQATGWFQAFDACGPCKRMFENLIAAWEQGMVAPSTVVHTMRTMGYTRLDAARFLLELVLARGPRLRTAIKRAHHA